MNDRNNRRYLLRLILALSVATLCLPDRSLAAPQLQFAHVVAKKEMHTAELPGELYPFLSVQLQAKVASYVDKVLVDRGSFVKPGETLVQLSAPEMTAHVKEAESRLSSAEADQAQAEAQLAAETSTYTRIKEASQTPGAVAENDATQAKQQTEAAQALVRSRQRTVESLRSTLRALQDLTSYLQVSAPFAGVISTRYVHPGALVGPGSDSPLLQIDQIARLRLTVAVPEADAANLNKGDKIVFKVPAYPDKTYTGTIARPAHALDRTTRTMPVEMDVFNPHRLLAPGMYAAVQWPITQAKSSLLVPSSSIVTTTERVFVIRNNHGRAQWVNVRRGLQAEKLTEVSGDLRPGDEIVQLGTDEIRDGAPLMTEPH